jgi:hypothetical protein
MTRYSSKSADEVPDKHSDNARRRTAPADLGPASPREIDRIYRMGKTVTQPKDPEHQPPQFPEDKRDEKAGRYSNDVKPGWLRGSGIEGACARPTYDHQPEHQHKVPKGNKATGQDCDKSPFSAAYRRGNGEGF